MSPPGSGTVDPPVGVNAYPEGRIVEVIPTPAEGYQLDNWNGACSGFGDCTVTMDADKNVTAVFAPDIVYLTMDTTGPGKVIQNPMPSYHRGQTVTLTADPDMNMSFTGWGGACAGQGNPCTLTMDVDKSVSTTFEDVTCYLPQNLVSGTNTLREDFESLSGWTVSGGAGYAVTLDTVNYKTGNAALKMTTPTAAGYVTIRKTVNWNLASADEKGNFRFWVYVYGSGEPVDFNVMMSNDTGYRNYFTTYYNAPIKFRYRPGWNLVNLRASDWFVAAGTPSWNNPITSITIRFYNRSSTAFSLDGLESGISIPAVVLTFDDAHSTVWDPVYSYMEPLNLRGTEYVITDSVGTVDRVTWDQLQAMYNTGWTIGNHTAVHSSLSDLPEPDQEIALATARDALIAHGMTNVNYVAYPWGNYNADTLTAMANLDMRSARTLLNFNNVSPLTNPYELAQKSIGKPTTLDTAKGYVNTAIARGETVILVLHDISDNPTNAGWYPNLFKQYIDYLVAQGVPVITMDDLYRLQSGDITIPKPANGSCWNIPTAPQYTLTVNQPVGGSIAPPTASYPAGSVVSLTATANTGYHFVAWTGACSGSGACSVTMNANKSVGATFDPDLRDADGHPGGRRHDHGFAGGPHYYNEVVTLTATA